MIRILFILLVLPKLLYSQYSIKGQFTPAENFTYAFLYKNTPSGADYIDRAKLNSDGSFTIEMDENSETGIYKIVYATPPENNNFNFFYDGKEDIIALRSGRDEWSKRWRRKRKMAQRRTKRRKQPFLSLFI